MSAPVELTSTHSEERRLAINRSAVLVYGSLLLIVLFNLWGNLYWIRRNVVLVGRDAGGHLTRALQYVEILQRVTPQTLFEALTYHGYRPPAFYIAAQIPYRLLGRSMDAAQLVNVALLVVSLGLTFAFGRRTIDERAAVMAVLLTGLFPMTAAMTRLFYLENFQTAAVLLILLALLLSQGFARRGWTMLWGMSIGAGLLVKWSVPIYTVLPSLVVFCQAGLFREELEAVRHPRVQWRVLLFALTGALVLAALWYLPNRQRALTLPLGDALFVVWVVLLIPAFYALMRPRRPLTNFWAGAFLGMTIASVWYVARIDFLGPLLDSTYGTYGGNYRAFSLGRLTNYTRNPQYLVTHHFGPLASILLLPATLLPWLRRRRGWRSARVGAWLLWGSLLSTYIFTAFASQDGERNLVPILPILAILAADSLRHYPRRPAVALGVVWVMVLAAQWALFTFDQLGALHQRTAALWARGEFVVRPASGATDPSYWIQPDVLETIRASHDPANGPRSIFGMLVNSIEVHRGPFNYLILERYPEIDLITLTERENQDAWVKTVRSEWVLTKDGDNHDVDHPGLRALTEVYQNPDGIFPLLFTPVKRYPFPDGETATLWRRVVGLPYLPRAPEGLRPLGDALRAWLRGQTLLLGREDQALTLGLLDLAPQRVMLLDAARPDDPTVFVLLHRGVARDPAALAWLDADYYPAYDGWFDSEFLEIWGRPEEPMTTTPGPHRFGGAALSSITTVAAVQAGNVVPIELAWDTTGETPLKVSVRLLSATGEKVAQMDRDLASAMRLGLFVPPATPAGSYTLALSVYDPTTLQPLPGGDRGALIELRSVEVLEASQGDTEGK
ncbi:MAG: glycosyltransferase family 39 protein [Ardenticatenaceae bacterium]|nr:glycosyltransferase family 39 protein [Ardenticatenaceae bacterium]